MNKLFRLFASLSILLTSCSDPIDSCDLGSGPKVYIEFVNGCEMPITMLNSNRYIIASLKPGDSKTFIHNTASFVEIEPLLYFSGVRNGYVVFEPIGEEDFVSIPFLSFERLLDREGYVIEDREHYRWYRYTFVQSDYQFALENGTHRWGSS
jgi:hypothetical protein